MRYSASIVVGLALLAGCATTVDGRPVAGSATPTTSRPRVSTATVVLAAPPPEWSVCSFLRAEEVAWLVDSTKPVESMEQPVKHKKSNGYVTYSCHYRTTGEFGAFAALTVLFAPNAGGKEAEGIEGATRGWANITPLSGVGDGAATYTDPKNPSSGSSPRRCGSARTA